MTMSDPAPNKTCETCGTRYRGKSNSKTCSPECTKKRAKQWNRAKFGVETHRTCKYCSRPFSLDDSNGSFKYCSPTCSVDAQNERYRERTKAARKAKPHPKCVNCGDDMPGAHPNRKTCSAKCRNQHKRNLPSRRTSPDYRLSYLYGTTLDELSRGGAVSCEICGTTDPGGKHGSFHIDHDHSCCSGNNKRTCYMCTRGVLCPKCNVALGYFNDDSTTLMGAAVYVEKWKSILAMRRQETEAT